MQELYTLMHGNDAAAFLEINSENNTLLGMSILNRELLPYLGNADKAKMQAWLRMRSIPGTREDLARILEAAQCGTRESFFFTNLAVSINDCYWLCPENLDLSWQDVNPHRNYRGGQIPLHNDTSYDPSASLGGQMSKYIDMQNGKSEIVKSGTAYFGLQCYNEVIATDLHKRQDRMPFADYHAFRNETSGRISCSSRLFTSEGIEFITAYELMGSAKQSNQLSNYDFYIDLCERNGIRNARAFMDYMTLTDFVLTNTDRHLNNFGVLRDSDSLKLIGMAPLFDSGNSMFYNQIQSRPLTRAEILDIPITAFHKREEKMIRHITDRGCVSTALLPTPEEVAGYYKKAGIPENIVDNLASDYAVKLRMTEEFQNGKNLSRYAESSLSKQAASSSDTKVEIKFP